MLTLYGSPNTRSVRVAWMLAELNLDYEYHAIALMQGEGQSEDYLAINPAGKLPALRDGDTILTESSAIVTYLGDKYGEGDLVPKAGTALRGKYDQWCYFSTCELEQPLWTIAKHKFAIPEEYRVPDIFPTAAWEFQRALQLLGKGLEGQDYILGNDFTAADILLGHTLIWAQAFKQELNVAGIPDYLDRVRNRPALQIARKKESGEA